MTEPLPQLSRDRLFIGDGGLETSLIFQQGLELPDFAAFTLLADDGGRDALRAYFEPYLGIARDHDVGLVLDTVTWRANPDWAARLGYSPEALDDANRDAVALAGELARPLRAQGTPVVVNGVLGPRGDGYVAGEAMSPQEAERYHSRQVETLGAAGAEMVTAVTMTYAAEAVGIVRAARAAGIPVAISFTVETDGRLPDGQPLAEAVEQVDGETAGAAAYFMINCAHPTHFEDVLVPRAPWLERIVGIRANASTRSHAELDEAEELDDGDPDDLAARYAELSRRLPAMNLVGGCCGTDHRHVAAACAACLS
jgi:S-methylmethionine-dependent homocysteine/selenocysteine methylase